MKYRRKKHLRITAIFLLINFMQSIILPPLAHALTSGPTAPEATSFEPVDTTDMVNLQTGDFTYNIPLLEVPGPEGGYPLSLSYHAGIKPLEDASWVGLGWSLNPGAINRVVNGIPDDHKDVKRTVRDYWEGGETTSFSVGASIGLQQSGASLGFDITVSNDTYKGFGGDVSLNAQFNIAKLNENNGIGAGASISAGSSGFVAGGNIGLSGQLGSVGLSASTNFNGQGGVALGVSSRRGIISTGVSLSSRGLKPSLSASGNSLIQQNDNFGNISTSGGGFNLPIPIGPGVFLNVGHRYTRYWMDETDDVWGYGTLYAKEASTNFVSAAGLGGSYHGPVDKTFDCYALLDTSLNISNHSDPDWVLGGSLPSYDSYQVMAQGITGTMQPHIYENGSLFREKKTVENTPGPDVKNNFLRLSDFTKRVNFRFDNDFSNSFLYNAQPDLDFPTNSNIFDNLYNGNLTNNQTTPSSSTRGYNHTDQHLAGSKHVEWYTNAEIISTDPVNNAQSKGFINYPELVNIERTRVLGTTYPSLDDQIGGFSVTNESGVTYHYALPVYSFEEYSRSDRESSSNGDSFNEQKNPEPYAYTWLLTAITGPDFIDRGNADGTANGIVDEADWGYWVHFNYGRYVDDYQWRTPSVGKTIQANSEVKSYAYGKKQVYYLDAIHTRTHTALFVKDNREDAKSVTFKDGDFDVQYDTIDVHGPYRCSNPSTGADEIAHCYERSFKERPKSSLKLNKIVLIKNSDLYSAIPDMTLLKRKNSTLSYLFTYPTFLKHDQESSNDNLDNFPVHCDCSHLTPGVTGSNYHWGSRVLDIYDIQNLSTNILDLSIKSIDFGTSYTLAPETINSLDTDLLYQTNFQYQKFGKLTLDQLEFKGKAEHQYLPPILFDYELDNPSTGTFNTTRTNSRLDVNITPSAGIFNEGDIIKHTDATGNQYFGLLTKELATNTFTIESLGQNSFSLGMSGTLEVTKNPPFDKDKYDYWGYYKSDYDRGAIESNHLLRQPNLSSSLNTDVWSLRKITTSLGAEININYQPKVFNHIEMLTQNKLKINSITKDITYNGNNRLVKLSFSDDLDIDQYFAVGDLIPTLLAEVTAAFDVPVNSICAANIECKTGYSTDIPITAIGSDYLYALLPNTFYTLASQCELDDPDHLFVNFGDGFICLDTNTFPLYGNGPQVASISIQNALGIEESKTQYTYYDGQTSYIPYQSEMPKHDWCGDPNNTPLIITQLFEDYKNIFAKARELPAPGIMYGRSKIEETAKDGSSLGSRQYTFQTFEKDMVSFEYGTISYNTIDNGTTVSGDTDASQRTVALRDWTSRVGHVLKIEEFNSLGQLVNNTENFYAERPTDLSQYNDQGVIHQSFNEVRFKEDINFRKAVVTTKKVYPSPLISSVSSSMNGTSNTTFNRAFDYLSGELICVETTNQHGESTMSVSTPAYRVDEQYYGNIGINANPNMTGMGPMVNQPKNKNMLLQTLRPLSIDLMVMAISYLVQHLCPPM